MDIDDGRRFGHSVEYEHMDDCRSDSSNGRACAPVMGNLFNILRPSCLVVFQSDYEMVKSIEHLRAVTLPPGFDAESKESMMGSVEQDSVRLEHSLPWPNSQMLRPHFTGSFQRRDGKVVLAGQVVESTWMTFSFNPFNHLLRPSFRDEISWLSKAIEQALTKPT